MPQVFLSFKLCFFKLRQKVRQKRAPLRPHPWPPKTTSLTSQYHILHLWNHISYLPNHILDLLYHSQTFNAMVNYIITIARALLPEIFCRSLDRSLKKHIWEWKNIVVNFSGVQSNEIINKIFRLDTPFKEQKNSFSTTGVRSLQFWAIYVTFHLWINKFYNTSLMVC